MTADEKPPTYSLDGAAGDFYCILSDFTDDFLVSADEKYGVTVDEYMTFLSARGQTLRSREEYLLEPMIAGLFWNIYGSSAVRSHRPDLFILRQIAAVKIKGPFLKGVCGFLTKIFLPRIIRDGVEPAAPDLQDFSRLIRWMRSSGEFPEEALRLEGWLPFLAEKYRYEQALNLLFWSGAALEFAEAAEGRLGRFTSGVNTFAQMRGNERRTDMLLRRRCAAEYHFAMVAAEVMNRSSRKKFMSCQDRVVLVPLCSCESSCRARGVGPSHRCTGCSPDCTVGALAAELAAEGVELHVFRHSTGFSRVLDHWERYPETGIVFISCVPDIAAAGYGMRRRGMPFQCVFLNHSGCARRWDCGIRTTFSDIQVKHVLGIGHLNG